MMTLSIQLTPTIRNICSYLHVITFPNMVYGLKSNSHISSLQQVASLSIHNSKSEDKKTLMITWNIHQKIGKIIFQDHITYGERLSLSSLSYGQSHLTWIEISAMQGIWR